MSANSTAIHGQSSNAGLLGAAVVLTAVVAAGALGFVIGKGVATTTAERPAAGPVVDSTSMSGPRTAEQKGLARHQAAVAALAARHQAAIAATKDADASIVLSAPNISGVDGRFAAEYDRYLAAQQAAAIAAELNLTIADPKEIGAAIVVSPPTIVDPKETGAAIVVSPPIVLPTPGTALAAQYDKWLMAQSMAIGTDFPDMFQRQANMTAAAYGGSDFAGQYEQWLKAQAATADSAFPDWFQRATINTGTYGLDGYGGSDFAGQYEQWLKAQAAASSSSFPDYFQRHEAPAAGGTGGRSVRLAQ